MEIELDAMDGWHAGLARGSGETDQPGGEVSQAPEIQSKAVGLSGAVGPPHQARYFVTWFRGTWVTCWIARFQGTAVRLACADGPPSSQVLVSCFGFCGLSVGQQESEAELSDSLELVDPPIQPGCCWNALMLTLAERQTAEVGVGLQQFLNVGLQKYEFRTAECWQWWQSVRLQSVGRVLDWGSM
eukprot:1161262-Pelagomonas_calceolata.AAC.13